MEKLYNELLALSSNDDTPFYHSDQMFNGNVYRIFNYHYTDRDSWLLPSAMESRGTTFQIERDGTYIRLASRSMQKFFNYSECINKSNKELLWSAKNAFENGQLSEDLYIQLVDNPSVIPSRND